MTLCMIYIVYVWCLIEIDYELLIKMFSFINLSLYELFVW